MNTQLEDVWNQIVKYRNDKSLYMQEIKTNKSHAKKNDRKYAKTVGSMFVNDPNED